MRVEELPIELSLYIHSFSDEFKEYYSKQVLPEIQEKIKTQLIKKAFALLSKVKIQEAFEFIMDDNQFNYELVKTEPMLHHFDQTWFMNRIRMNKSWSK
jgi:predicted nucleic acid-binding protein